MSKKKNTLKDLDEFLKQQAATLVTPSKLGENTAVIPEAAPAAPAEPVRPRLARGDSPGLAEKIIADMTELSQQKGDSFKQELSRIILAVMNNQSTYSPEDKMLINTALYLQHGENWKDAIRQYWKNKNA